MMERGSTPFARQPMPHFPPRSPVATSDNSSFSSSSGGVDTYNSGHVFLRDPHRARTLGFPGCPLSVSAHPVLMGALPVSRWHASLGTLLYVLPWRTTQGQEKRHCRHPNDTLPTSWAVPVHRDAGVSPFHLARGLLICFSVIFMNNPAYPLCASASSTPACPLSTVPPLLGQLEYPCSCLFPFS